MPTLGRRGFLMALGSAGATAPFPSIAASLRESFEIAVPVAPGQVTVHGAQQLVYELHLTNFSADSLSILRLLVVEPASGATLREFFGRALESRLAQVRQPAIAGSAIAPGRRVVVYLELAFPAASTPERLIHRLHYAVNGAAETFTTQRAVVEVGDPAVILGPPLAGGPWVAVHSADWPRGHRRVIYTIDGRARIPGRFAIDWVRIDEEGRVARGDDDVAGNRLGYGEDVIAVADAVVVAIRDGMRESEAVSGNRRHSLADASGNHVVLQIGPRCFAFYEHLKPGSIRVRAGESATRGDVVAALGFTGDSTGPHLHFHVADAPSPLGGEGLPFAIERFELLGRYDDVGSMGQARWSGRPDTLAADRRHERPGPNDVIRFV